MRDLGVKQAVLSTVAMAMAGCMVGPNYRPPKASMPAGWIGTTTTRPTTRMSVTTAEEAAIATWWEKFNDPTLNRLIAQAIESNLDLRQAEARIVQARAQRGIVSAGLWPTVDASGSFRRSRAGGAGNGAPTPKPQNFYQAGFDAAWELDIFGGVRRGIEAADANIQVAVEDRRSVLVTLTSEVALNYVSLRGLQQQIAISRKNLEVQRQSASIAHKLAGAGFGRKLDTATADAQVASTLAVIPTQEAAAQQTIYNLSVLLGREPGALLAELSPTGAIPTTPPVVPVGLPSDLLRRRPDIRSAEAQLHAATAQIGVATADLFPKFSLTGSGGLQSSTLKSLGNWDSHFWSVGPSVSWTIFDAGRILSNIRVQNALQWQALIAWERSVLTALQDVESALIAYEKEQQRRTALTEAVAQNRTAVQISNQLYTAGQTSFLDVLTAERDLFATENALVQSEQAVAADLISLYKALGGGWENEGAATGQATTRPAGRP